MIELFSHNMFLQLVLFVGVLGLPTVIEILIRSRIVTANEPCIYGERKQKEKLERYDKIIAVLFYCWIFFLFVLFFCLFEWIFRLIF